MDSIDSDYLFSLRNKTEDLLENPALLDWKDAKTVYGQSGYSRYIIDKNFLSEEYSKRCRFTTEQNILNRSVKRKYNPIQCSICSKAGHNKRTCKFKPGTEDPKIKP